MWEYKTADRSDIGGNRSDFERFLNDMGRAGWELVAVFDEAFYFKRLLA